MKARKPTQQKRASTVVPPLAVSVDEALTRLMKVKPPEKPKRRTKRK